MNRRGIIGQIAKELNLNRHTVAKIYNNQVPSISLDVLSKICTWLQKQGVSTSELPAARRREQADAEYDSRPRLCC